MNLSFIAASGYARCVPNTAGVQPRLEKALVILETALTAA